MDIPIKSGNITGVAKAEIEIGYDAKFLEVQDIGGTDLIKCLVLIIKRERK